MERSKESFDVQLSGCRGVSPLSTSTLLFQTQVSKMKARRESRSNKIATISGGNDGEVPPVPIPNTEVKLSSAEDTWREAAWEIRKSPVFLRPYGQVVKTPPFHGGNPGSSPGRVTTTPLAKAGLLFTKNTFARDWRNWQTH